MYSGNPNIRTLPLDRDALIELVERTRPDVAILDIRMPPTHTDEGLRAAKIIRAQWPAIGILVLSQHVNTRYALELLSAGTDGIGYLLKKRVSDLHELSSSVNCVGNGGSVLDPGHDHRNAPTHGPVQEALTHGQRQHLRPRVPAQAHPSG